MNTLILPALIITAAIAFAAHHCGRQISNRLAAAFRAGRLRALRSRIPRFHRRRR